MNCDETTLVHLTFKFPPNKAVSETDLFTYLYDSGVMDSRATGLTEYTAHGSDVHVTLPLSEFAGEATVNEIKTGLERWWSLHIQHPLNEIIVRVPNRSTHHGTVEIING